MAEECGTAVEVRGDSICVETSPIDMCGSCASKGSCMVAEGVKARRIWMRNSLNAVVGDQVEFRIADEAVVGISILFYAFPIVMLIGGIFLGMKINTFLNVDRDLSAAIFGCVALAASFAAIKIVSGILEKKRNVRPELVAIHTQRGDVKS